jgi:hypothetical protein
MTEETRNRQASYTDLTQKRGTGNYVWRMNRLLKFVQNANRPAIPHQSTAGISRPNPNTNRQIPGGRVFSTPSDLVVVAVAVAVGDDVDVATGNIVLRVVVEFVVAVDLDVELARPTMPPVCLFR